MVLKQGVKIRAEKVHGRRLCMLCGMGSTPREKVVRCACQFHKAEQYRGSSECKKAQPGHILLCLAIIIWSKALISLLVIFRLALHFNAEFFYQLSLTSASSLQLLFLIMKVLLSLIFSVSIDSLCFFPQLHPLISSSITFVLHDTPQHWKKLLIKGCCPHFQWYPP